MVLERPLKQMERVVDEHVERGKVARYESRAAFLTALDHDLSVRLG